MKRPLPFLRGQHSVWGYLTLLLLACGPSVEHPPRSTAHAPVQPSSASSGSDADTRTSSTISSWKTGSAQTEAALAALDRGTYVTFRAEPGSFPLVSKGRAAPWVIADG